MLRLLEGEHRRRWELLAWTEPERAERLLEALGGRAGASERAIPFLEWLIGALPETPDPEAALLGLERWSEGLWNASTTLGHLPEHPRLGRDLLTLIAASSFLAGALRRDPRLFGLLLEAPTPREDGFYRRTLNGLLHSLSRPESRTDALRRFRRRELLRIAWRDVCCAAPLAEIVREISDLADALVAGALQLAREAVDARFPTVAGEVRFAVMALGKLGARELNYSSDVDLVFVVGGEGQLSDVHRRYVTRLAESLIAVLTENTAEGRCLRVDVRLRPEGRAGALVRSYTAFRAYYQGWAETWERQALIKCRFVAGHEELGKQFEELAQTVAYRAKQGATVVQDVREMRAAMEQKLAAAGELHRNVKEGAGCVRDVEFTVQLLQLLFGADHPALRLPDTLPALAALEQRGLLTPAERAIMQDGYCFFRTVEHRLQLADDLPIRLVPEDERSLRRLARSLGFEETAAFEAVRAEHTRAVRGLVAEIHGRLATLEGQPETALRGAFVAADRPEGADLLRREIDQRGFPDPEAALAALVRLAAGTADWSHPTTTRRLFADVAPAVLEGCAQAADPTLALVGLADFADRKVTHRSLYQTWHEHPTVLEALCRFAGAAPRALKVLLRYPELSDLVTNLEQLEARRDPAGLETDLRERLQSAPSPERAVSLLRRFKLREQVRLAARSVIRNPPAAEITREWSDVADVLVRAALAMAVERQFEARRWPVRRSVGFAVLALGRYGGRDLHFPSDLDLLYVYDERTEIGRQACETLARTFAEIVQSVTEEGPLFAIDARLRPEGRQGSMVTSVEAARRYYGEGGRGETWELQALTRTRCVAGDKSAAEAFAEAVLPRVYRDPMPEEWTAEIREMKRRIERERVTEAERARHLKLGPGGMSDIEFLVQWLQLRHGGTIEAVREVQTLAAVRALQQAEALAPDEATALETAHSFLTTARQALWLLRTEGSSDALPDPATDPRVAAALARALGFSDYAKLLARHAEVTVPVRAAFLWRLG